MTLVKRTHGEDYRCAVARHCEPFLRRLLSWALNALRVGHSSADGGNAFHPETALHTNERLVASSLQRGNCRQRSWARVFRTDTWFRSTKRERSAAGVRLSCRALCTFIRSRSRTISWNVGHSRARMAGEMWSLFRLPVITLAAKLSAFCTRACCVLHAPPHTGKQ